MEQWQVLFLLSFSVGQVLLFLYSLKQCKDGCSFHLTRWLAFLGMFVWGDVLVLSIFWFFVGLATLLLQDWLLLLLIYSVFWLVRSLGETVYWLLQQFAVVKRDKPESLTGYRFVKNESIWFIYQVMWQCVTVVTTISTIYLAHQWILS